MMMLSEIASVLNAKRIGGDVRVLSVGTDSRHIVKNQLFVAIKGERFDGNAFAVEAIKLGAAAALVTEVETKASPSIVVEDSRVALGQLAHYWRQKFKIPLVAVTGSSGKTTVKEMIVSILNASNSNVLATKGNLNNDIGMPISLLNLRDEHHYAVIEMGMNHLGEIRYLTNIARPQVALINNAGTAHIGELGSREAIAKAKGEIFEGLVDEGIAVINANDSFVDYWKALNRNRKVLTFGIDVEADVSAQYDMRDGYAEMRITTPEGAVEVQLNLIGSHNVSNALAASAVAVALGVPNKYIALGLSDMRGIQGRLNLHVGEQDALVIDDTYNANPDSMKAAIDVLVSQRTHSRNKLIFVMGDMAELGAEAEKMHAEIGAYAMKKGVSMLLSFGGLSKLTSVAFGENGRNFDVLDTLIEAIKLEMNAEACVLVKGSRSMKMERVVNAIIKDKNLGSAH